MTFSNIEGDPGHNFFSRKGIHMWVCLFIFISLCGFHFMRKFTSMLKEYCPCCCSTESSDVDIINDEKLPDYW